MATTTHPSRSIDVRVNLRRDRQGQWRWHARANGRTLADSGEGYSRRIDCLHAAMRVVGVRDVKWHGQNPVYDYGQGSRGTSVVEFYIWKRWVE